MVVARLDFARMLEQGGGTLNDRISEFHLSETAGVTVNDFIVSRASLENAPGFMRLLGLTPTGYSITCDKTAGMGVSFPDHADYDLGTRWTIDVYYKPTSLPTGSDLHPIYWRADDSNNRVTTLEINADGKFVFTHRDSSDNEDTLTSAAGIAAGTATHVRVSRFRDVMVMFIDGAQSSTTSGVSETNSTKACDNKWYVGVGTTSDGDTVTGVASCDGVIDEFRVWREEWKQIDTDADWVYSEWPWLGDERLVLYARFNEASGSITDWSLNSNSGTALASVSQGDTALATALSPIVKLVHMRTSAGVEKWCLWSNGSFYAEAVR